MDKHKQSPFEKSVMDYLERRKGQVVDDTFLGKFASFFWRKRVKFELAVMRSMREYPD